MTTVEPFSNQERVALERGKMNPRDRQTIRQWVDVGTKFETIRWTYHNSNYRRDPYRPVDVM